MTDREGPGDSTLPARSVLAAVMVWWPSRIPLSEAPLTPSTDQVVELQPEFGGAGLSTQLAETLTAPRYQPALPAVPLALSVVVGGLPSTLSAIETVPDDLPLMSVL